MFLYICLIILAAWCVYLSVSLNQTRKLLENLSQIKKGSLTDILQTLLKSHEASKKEFKEIYREIERLDLEKTKYLKNSALVRFNPFGKNEYEQSFCLALLDSTGTGVVITSIHTNNMARIYSKSIVRGQGKIELSPEEKNAVQLAMKS